MAQDKFNFNRARQLKAMLACSNYTQLRVDVNILWVLLTIHVKDSGNLGVEIFVYNAVLAQINFF